MKAVGDLIFKYLNTKYFSIYLEMVIRASYFESYLETYQVWHTKGKVTIKELTPIHIIYLDPWKIISYETSSSAVHIYIS